MKKAVRCTHRRCVNGVGTGTGARFGARATCLLLDLPLPLIATDGSFVVQRFIMRPMMIEPS